MKQAKNWIECTKLNVNRLIRLSFRCDCLLGTPPMFIDILAHPDLKKYDLSSLRKGNGVCTKLNSPRIIAQAKDIHR